MNQRRGGFQLDATSMGLTTSKPPIAKTKKQTEQQPTYLSGGATGEATKNSPKSDGHSTENFKASVEQLRGICGDGAKMNFEMNEMFLKRLESIDTEAGGDSELRLVTLQDWVDHLLHVNYLLFGNMSALEMDVFKKIMNAFQDRRGEQQQTLDENRRLRKDICAIIKLVQEAYHHNKWNTNDICLETMTLNQLLGLQECHCQPLESEAEKVTKCMQSLANEVAAKHDEVCQLQEQLKGMDEIVQTARQKLILKDKCIAQLNQRLMELQDCVSKMSMDTQNVSNERLAAIDSCANLDLESSSCLFESLNQKDQQTSELLRMLNIELTEFIDLVSKNDLQAIDHHRKLLSCFFERISLDRTTTQNNLDALRSQLRNLERNLEELEAPIAANTEIISDEGDAQLVDKFRRHVQSIVDGKKQLNVRIQQLETQYRVQLLELQFSYEAERSVNQKNCQALKEIADLFSKLRRSSFTYEELYEDSSSNNPFCLAILDMHEKLTEMENSKVMEELCQNNERLIGQIHSLKCALEDREGQITQLRSVMEGYVDATETNRLKDEIYSLKQRNTEQAQKISEIAALLKQQEEERHKLCSNYEHLLNAKDDQSKELRRAKKDAQNLLDRLSDVERTQEDLKTERKLLREEIVGLKEKEARSTGRERAMTDQLRSRQQELEKSRTLLRDMHIHLKQEERQHKDTVDRLCHANEEISLQMQAMSCECKQMQQKLKKQTLIAEQQQLIIDTFRKWKDAQKRSDEAMRMCIRGAEEHVNRLLEENLRLSEEYKLLFGDYAVIEAEMRRVKRAVNMRLPSGGALSDVVVRGQKVQEEMANRLILMRTTSKRLTEQVRMIQTPPSPSPHSLPANPSPIQQLQELTLSTNACIQ
ncbi:putative leucine-rich repeat-containing protein DDB_G0290503 isoform X1 [Drosophila sulfurigaster albostrigata]|uniref:putative leucine-rich repeat-containing protein DDB_G0290503 isoform X1 n=1 Tax=Drosophila sulfurigaster albostrigata TaxID=89887 RepID=UPI002D21A9E0|nr:putative leucine-rich repeat-containing protein DDB_G0290503 isoform X1 [Drosophila sulfurigaster albostrigata]